MWLLLIVLLAVPGRDIVIEPYANEEECQKERDRIGREMADAYPYERDFVIVCQLQATVI